MSLSNEAMERIRNEAERAKHQHNLRFAPLVKMIQAQIRKSYVAEYQSHAKDADGLGLIISRYFQWDGLEILKTLSVALEDANFHAENAVICEMIEKIEAQTNLG